MAKPRARTNVGWLNQAIEASGIPPRTLEQVKADLVDVRANGDGKADISMARLMADAGNLTDDAIAYAREYARRRECGEL